MIDWWTVAAVFAGCLALSMVSSVYPKGDHMALARLSLAAICRTILPLAIFLVMEYTTAFSVGDCVIPIVVGFLLTMALSTGFAVRRHHQNRLHQTAHDQCARHPSAHPLTVAETESQAAAISVPQRVDALSLHGKPVAEAGVNPSTPSQQGSRSRI